MELDIRKLRKKLRQVEILERLDRNLNKDEREKVCRKEILRTELFHLLDQCTKKDVPLTADFGNGIEFVAGVSPDVENADLQHHESEDISQEFSEFAMKRSRKSSGHIESPKSVPNKKRRQESETPSSEVPGPSQSPQSLPEKQSSSKSEEPTKTWTKVRFLVRSLHGHNDLITCAALDNNLLVTGSRDTTIKIWDADTGIENLSLRGHTGGVTCLLLLDTEDSKAIAAGFSIVNNSSIRIVVSGSHDCCINIWSTAGILLRSMYTYNSVVSIGYITDQHLIVVGSDSGKLELWDPLTGMNIQSFRAYEDPITCIKVLDDEVVTTGGDGTAKIWNIRFHTLEYFAESSFIKNSSYILCRRYIRSLAMITNRVYFGDDGVNIKVWNLKLNTLYKLNNHLNEFGTTDALCVVGKFLLSSSYNLDSGKSIINVRAVGHDQYIGSLDDNSTRRIMAITATVLKGGLLRIITAGQELKIWDMVKKNGALDFRGEADIRVVVEPYVEPLFMEAPVDSDVYSDDSGTSGPEDEIEEIPFEPEKIYLTNQNSFWQRWCSIL